MKIKKIDIENFRSVQEISIELKANLNVFVGVNGAGKTTLLDAISTMMSWFVNRIQRQNASGNYISDSDIRNDAPFSKIDITVTEKGRDFNWKLYKSSKGKNSSEKSLMNEVSELTFYFRDKLSEGSSLPVVAFYPVTRVVDKTMPEIKGKESLYILDAYDNALGGKRNYQSFFEWFRIQDDIVNEEAMSRSKWIEQNQTWIKKRIKKLLGLMKDTFKKDDLEVSSDEYKYLIKNFENDELIYKEPRFLFHELSRLIEMVGMRTRPDFRYEKIFRDLEYMFHKMEMYSTEYRDDLIDEGGRYEESILQIIRDFNHLFREDIMDNTPIKFIWETFVFANILSLWWMSERGKHEIEKQLRKYLPGVNQSEREWRSLSENLVGTLQEIIRSEIKQKKNAYKGEGKELKTVSKAIEQFVPEYSSLRVKRVPRPHMLINKGNDSFNLDQLSDGEGG
jgi:energy-coupling factor transporter ATP-binding protein EcfA2